MRSLLGALYLVALAGCSAATAPTAPPPSTPSMAAGGVTSPADPGGCGGDLSVGAEKHCAPGKAPGASNSPGNSGPP